MLNNNYLRSSLLCFILVISVFFMWFGHEVWGGVCGLLSLVILALVLSNMNIMHPLTWFPPVYFLYSVSLPILVTLGKYPFRGDLKETLFLEWIGLLTFIIVLGLPIKDMGIKVKEENELNKFKNMNIILYPLYIISIVLTFVYMLYIYTSGLKKYAISLDDSPMQMLVSIFPVYTLTFFLLFIYKMIKNKRYPLFFLVFNLLYAFFALLIIGERDLLLKVLIGGLIITHIFYRRISKKILLLFGASIISLIPFLQKLKSIITANDSLEAEESHSLLYEVLRGEFISASRNLNTLLTNTDQWSYFGGKTFIWDVQAAFLSGGNSTLGWFNTKFYPSVVSQGGGKGFSIVGEGYINFGVIGVILIFILVGLLLRFLFLQARVSSIWFAIYVASIPIFIYINRADLANLYAQVGKQIVLPVLIIFGTKFILERAIRKDKIKKNNTKSTIKH